MLMIIAGGTAAEGDARAFGDQRRGLFAEPLVEEIAAVDHRRSQRLMLRARSGARHPGFADMKAELLGGAFAEELHGVAALDQRDAFGDLALEFDRADFAAVLLALLLALRLLVAIDIAFDPLAGTVKDIDDVPEQVFKIRLDARVDEAAGHREIGRAHVRTPVTNAPLVCRLLIAQKKKI